MAWYYNAIEGHHWVDDESAPDANMIIGGSYSTDKETIDTDQFIYGSYNQEGSTLDFNFNNSFLGNYSSLPITEPLDKNNSSTNLLEAVKISGDNVSKSIGELTQSMNNISKVLERSVLSGDNIAQNITMGLSKLVMQQATANKINHNGIKLQNQHNEKQTIKNDKLIESLDFQKNGLESLLGSDNEPIKPREAKALKDNEIGKDKSKENQVDYESLLDDLPELSNPSQNNPDDIMSIAVKAMIDAIDVTKIDKGVQNA